MGRPTGSTGGEKRTGAPSFAIPPIGGADVSETSDEEYLKEQFRSERRNRLILGILALVIAAALGVGFLFYFGATSAVPW